ncbi:uncharacterized protein [Lolium perenne]|uniref:uncharacterized protein n=1 Tax=Lolium perenne TaxID=4522 RepID=UPI0021EA9281
MAEGVTAEAASLLRGLPDDIVLWEIIIRLPPKYLLRCRAVRRAWRAATSARDFLLAHHARQPSLPIFSGDDAWILGVHYHNILAFDHRAATEDDQLHAVARLDDAFRPVAACDGLLVLSKLSMIGSGSRLSICNPATREHALLGLHCDFDFMGMYVHGPTGEHRLLLQRKRCQAQAADLVHKDQIGCYVFSLGSDQPPRFIGSPEMASRNFSLPVRVRDSLHWYPVYCPTERKALRYESKLVVFDTISESFRQMREPIVRGNSYVFDMDGTLGIFTLNRSTESIDIRVLQHYESEVWDLKYQIKLPVAKIRREFEDCGDYWQWDLDVVLVDGGVLLLVQFPRWLLHVDSNGRMVNSFYRGCRSLSMSGCQLKQSLVQHTFFPALEGYAVNASPFIQPVQ